MDNRNYLIIIMVCELYYKGDLLPGNGSARIPGMIKSKNAQMCG